MSIKRYIPSFLKSFFWQNYLRIKHGKQNTIKHNVLISRDFKCGTGNFIGSGVIIGRNVELSNGVRIGSNVRLENLIVGDNSFIDGFVICTGHGSSSIKIGKECYIGIYNVLDWSNNITIGDFVHIAGPSTGIWTHSSAKMCLNGILLKEKSEEYRPTAPITIESNVYIGGNCTIYPGVTIGHHSVVAPNSAVNKDVPPYTMVGGVPAKFIKTLKEN